MWHNNILFSVRNPYERVDSVQREDNSTLQVHGIASVKVATENGAIITLEKMLDVPKLQPNLIFVALLDEQIMIIVARMIGQRKWIVKNLANLLMEN